jgi:predicted membrane metal-binding protein
MSTNRQHRSNSFLWFVAFVALAIATGGAISYVTYRNLQIQTAREIEATEKRIASLVQDDIPGIQAEIDRQLARYDLREKLQRNGSQLISTPSHRIELIRVKQPAISQQSFRP